MSEKSISFEDLCGDSQPVDTCVALGLLWLAVSDGNITTGELKKLNEYYESAPGSEVFQEVRFKHQAIEAINEKNSDVLVKVCTILKNDLKSEEQKYFFHLLIDVASANDSISVPKNYILRMFADLFDMQHEYLNKEYLLSAGEILPEAVDPSSPLWWEFEENIKNGSDESNSFYSENLSNDQARQVLGLSKNATSKEIKIAYRRLAQHYHPDRHTELSDSKRDKAEKTFILVQQAYEVLKG